MRLADNVVVHDPEVNVGRIKPERLRAYGWSEEVVQQLRRSKETNDDLVAEIAATIR